MEETEKPTPAAAPKKRGKGLLLTIVAVIVLGAGGGGTWWWLSAAPTAEGKPVEVEHGLLSFEPFLVNLAGGGPQYLKCNLQLVVGSVKEAALTQESKVRMMQARSAIIELLTQQSAPTLMTPEGKQTLKKAIQERVGALLPEIKVVDVLFADFVVQF